MAVKKKNCVAVDPLYWNWGFWDVHVSVSVLGIDMAALAILFPNGVVFIFHRWFCPCSGSVCFVLWAVFASLWWLLANWCSSGIIVVHQNKPFGYTSCICKYVSNINSYTSGLVLAILAMVPAWLHPVVTVSVVASNDFLTDPSIGATCNR